MCVSAVLKYFKYSSTRQRNASRIGMFEWFKRGCLDLALQVIWHLYVAALAIQCFVPFFSSFEFQMKWLPIHLVAVSSLLMMTMFTNHPFFYRGTGNNNKQFIYTYFTFYQMIHYLITSINRNTVVTHLYFNVCV